MVCGASIIVVFKNMEFIVHGQLYDFGLIFNAEWADPYRIFTWLIFVFVGVPAALSGIALLSSFLKVEQSQLRKDIVPQTAGPPRGITKTGSQEIRQSPPVRQSPQASQVEEPVKEVRRIDNGNCVGISCPECKKVFGRALVMLDFRSGTNRMVSVCPYCNHVLGYTTDEKAKNDEFSVGFSEKKIQQ